MEDYFDFIFFTKLENGFLELEIFVNPIRLKEKNKINHSHRSILSFNLSTQKWSFFSY